MSGEKNLRQKGMAEQSLKECINQVVSAGQDQVDSEVLKGSGFFDEQILFTELYKFLQELGKEAGYEIESVRDIKEALSSGRLSKLAVQNAYSRATGKRLDFHGISQRVGRTMRIIELVAQENYQIYQKLVGVSEKYLSTLNAARGQTRDSEFRQVLDELAQEFEYVQQYIQFISQRQLKASYVPPAQDYTYDDEQKQLFTALHRLQRVLKFCFAPDHILAKKFVEKLKQYSSKFDSQVYLMRLIRKSPLVLNSAQYTPAQIVDALERAYEQLSNIKSKSERGQYLAKLIKISQNIMKEKMTDRLDQGFSQDPQFMPQHRSIYQTLTQRAIVKDQRINIFKHRVNHFYIMIIKQFIQLLDKKHYQDLAKMSQDLQLAVYELSEIQKEMLEGTEQDINDIINYLRQDKHVTQLEYTNSIYRLKTVREDLARRESELSGAFASAVGKMLDLFTNLIKYLDKTVKRGIDQSPDDILDVEHYGLEMLGDDAIYQQNQQNQEWLAFITNYLTVFHMRQNLARVKREIQSIDESTYQSKTTYKQLQQVYNECERFYQQVDEFYTKPDDKHLKCDPVLAKYLYHVALRFQSCMYITKGRSTHPAFNPRYYLFGVGEAITGPGPNNFTSNPAAGGQTVQQALNQYLPFGLQRGVSEESGNPLEVMEYYKQFYTCYNNWRNLPRHVGLMEELAAHKMKYNKMSIENVSYKYNSCIPKQPESFKKIEQELDNTDTMQNTIYKNLSQNPFLTHIAASNYQLAMIHFRQLVQDLYRQPDLKIGTDFISANTYGIDEFKYLLIFSDAYLQKVLPTPNSQYIFTSAIDNLVSQKIGKTEKLTFSRLADILKDETGDDIVTSMTVFVENLVNDVILPYTSQIGMLSSGTKPANTYQTNLNNAINISYQAAARGVGPALTLAQMEKYRQWNAKKQELKEFIKEQVDISKSRIQIAEQIYNKVIKIIFTDPQVGTRTPTKFEQLDRLPSATDPAAMGPRNVDPQSFLKYLLQHKILRRTTLALVVDSTGHGGQPFIYDYRFGQIESIFDTSVTTSATFNQFYERPSMYQILQVQRPSIINQLMYTQSQQIPLKTSVAVPRGAGEYQFYTNQVELTTRIVQLLQKQQKQAIVSEYGYVSCMCDENLKEYLLPSVQLPFIGPGMKDAYIPIGSRIETDTLLRKETNPDHNNLYWQSLFAQYGRKLRLHSGQIQSGSPYVVGYSDSRRHVVDSMYEQGSVQYTINGNYPITPMFGQYLFMPILHLEQKYGMQLNKSEEVVRRAFRIKDEYDQFLNCYITEASRATARDYIDDPMNMNMVSKRNSVYFAIEADQSIGGQVIDRQSTIYKSRTNAFFEYQLFMAQQLQYFTVHGCKFVFDPLIRKQIFEVANKIYRGLPLSKFDDNLIFESNKLQDYSEYLSRPFGQLQKLSQNPYQLQYAQFANTDNAPFSMPDIQTFRSQFLKDICYKPPKGFYPITDDYVNNQPRLALGVVLKPSSVCSEFIDACLAKDESLIQGDVLKVSEHSFSNLLKVLEEDEKRESQKYRFRVYLSESIRLQYHANACVLERTEPIDVKSKESKEFTLEDFNRILKRVIRIKKRGYKSLLMMAEQIDRMLADEVRVQVSSNMKFSDIRDMLDKLMLHSRTREATSQLSESVLSKCMNVNQYLSVYGRQNPFNTVYRQRNKLLGSGVHFKSQGLYSYDLAEYYNAITEYLDYAEKEIKQDENVQNFAKLFTHIYQRSESEQVKKIDYKDIHKYMVDYLIASSIDVDTSVLETDFQIEKLESSLSDSHKLIYKADLSKNPASILKDKASHELTQFEYKMKSKMRLIGIDAIFIPQNWQVSSSNMSGETALVPRQPSQCTQELDFLYNNIVNAMAQKLINVLNMHVLQNSTKKSREQGIVLPRILLGSGKKKRSRSQEKAFGDLGQRILSKDDFESKKIELYYRMYLLGKYYFNFFKEEIKQAETESKGKVLISPILIILKPTTECPEGKFLKFMFQQLQKGEDQFTQVKVEELVHKIDAIADKYHAGDNFNLAFQKLVEYVNMNYGMISLREYNQYDALLKQSTDNTENKFALKEVYDQLQGVDIENTDTLLKMSDDTTDPVPYINTLHFKQYLEKKITTFQELLKKNHKTDIKDFKDQNFTLSRLFRNLRIDLKNATREQKIIKLRHLINDQNHGFRGDYASPIKIHERVLFVLHLAQQLHTAGEMYSQMPHIFTDSDPHADKAKQVMKLAQIANIFTHEELCEAFPVSNKSIDFKYNYDNQALLSTIERLKLYVLANIKSNSKLADQVTIQINVSGIATQLQLSKPDTISAITKLFDKIKTLFSQKEPLSDKDIKAFEEVANDDQKQYDDVVGKYFEQAQYKDSTNTVTLPFKTKEIISETPIPGYYIEKVEDGKTNQPINEQHYIKDGIVYVDKIEREQSAASSAGPGAIGASGGIVMPPGGPGLVLPRKSIITSTIAQKAGLKLPANVLNKSSDQELVSRLVSNIVQFNNSQHSASVKTPGGSNELSNFAMSAKTKDSKDIKLVLIEGGEVNLVAITGDSMQQQIINEVQKQNKSGGDKIKAYSHKQQIVLRSKIPGRNIDKLKLTGPNEQEYSFNLTNVDLLTQTNIKNVFDEIKKSKKPFTDRRLQGGTLNEQTDFLGTDQIVYKVYDEYPDPTMQFNSIIKQLIRQTSVISSVPRAFAALFQGIWTGQGSQQDYEMIVNYKQHHLDDFRADSKTRIQTDNYKQHSRNKVQIAYIDVKNARNAPAAGVKAQIGMVSIGGGEQFKIFRTKQLGNGSIDIIIYNPDVQDTAVKVNISKDELDSDKTMIHKQDIEMKLTGVASDYTVDLDIYIKEIEQQILQETKYSISQALIPGVLYDGFQVGMSLYSENDVVNRNKELFKDVHKIRTHYTSSVLHFASKLLQELHLMEGERKVLDAGKIPVLQHDTEIQIVSSCVYAHMQLECLLSMIQSQLKALDLINVQDMSIADRNKALQSINTQMSYLTSLQQTIQRFIQPVEQFIQKKSEYIQGLLCDTKTGSQGLVSSFYHAIELDLTKQVKLFDQMEIIVYARYIFERMQCDSRQIISKFTQQFGQGIDQSLLNEVEQFVWMLIKIKHKLKLSSFYGNALTEEEKMEEGAVLGKYASYDSFDLSEPFTIIEHQLLPIQKSDYKTLPCRNPDVFRRIIETLTGEVKQSLSSIEEVNLLDLGILPINLNMLKKDVGLFHVFFNSALYKESLKNINLSDDKTLVMNPNKSLMGMNLEDMALIGANSFLRRHITKDLALMQENKSKAENSGKMMLLTKQDQFRYELHLRLALAMYALSNNMRPAEGEPFSPLNQPSI